ncbi:MAG: ATP-dependent DNA helicase RecG [Dehalococcoidia bacterium]|nr:ATP-dependent DNA helicase RecG [Dehalococcoidia bacterium]
MVSKQPNVVSGLGRLETFRRILKLEEQRGYDNKAVTGGLDAFAVRLREELAASGAEGGPLLERLQAAGVLGKPYGDLAPEARRVWVSSALAAVADTLPGGTPGADALAHTRDVAPSPLAASQAPAVVPPAQAPKQAPNQTTRPAAPSLPLSTPVTKLRGVGSGIAEKLSALGIATVGDFVQHFPRRHLTPVRIADLEDGSEQAVVGTVWEVRTVRAGARNMQSTEAELGDDSGNIRAVWFNQPFVAKNLHANDRVMLTGYFREFRGQPTLEANSYEILNNAEGLFPVGRPFPVYPTTEGLTQRTIRRLIRETLALALPAVEDHLPQATLQRLALQPRAAALSAYHYPEDSKALEPARRRLAFDELLVAQLAMLARKQRWQQADAIPLRPPEAVMQAFVRSLPFTLTAAQTKALDEVFADLARSSPMSRLLQGEVGSGKTVIALAALLSAAVCGHQAVLMAPTEILAEQHFITVSRLLHGLARPSEESYVTTVYVDPHPQPIAIGLLLGSMPKRAKADLRERVAKGIVDIVVGTHALIQDEVDLPRLAIAVVDEQHRFGVEQRAALRAKGTRPHLLAMSATPIPRSLALTLFGDLDLSVLDQLPPGRVKVRTRWLRPDQRDAAYSFVRKQVEQGRQAFVICPLIGKPAAKDEGRQAALFAVAREEDAKQVRAAQAEYETLAHQVFPDLRVGLLHGRMSLREKVAVMERFRARDLDILVSTPVIEVGVDVPNASVMMIESADRFGLAELHQFRGRVGRGEHPSYCMLLSDDPSPEAQARLALLEKESDGFRVAEEDLRLRGEGEVLGTRQSGVGGWRVARLSDQELVQLARTEAERLLAKDVALERPEHRLLAAELESVLKTMPDYAEPS